MEGTTNGAQGSLANQIEADLKNHGLSLPDAKPGKLLYKTLVIQRHPQQCIGSGTNLTQTFAKGLNEGVYEKMYKSIKVA